MSAPTTSCRNHQVEPHGHDDDHHQNHHHRHDHHHGHDVFADKSHCYDTPEHELRVQGIAAAIVKHAPNSLNKNTKLMDFGAGTGLLTKYLAPHVGHVTAVDVSPSMLEQFRSKAFAKQFAKCTAPGGFLALADLDRTKGDFRHNHHHQEGGMVHRGIERSELEAYASQAGFVGISFHTVAVDEEKDGDYPIFLMTAKKST
ncbi:Methyltransferase [Seminavis robusta]|uniref:Methyltransferase n=1 Tax=Seminavis robusta TaxID=568900 RepID=A0A9N8DL53_9STRA|nr:Methyltransferase [Seminavis robusta]|eukprot:Sro144_g067130.1 Methyltransferase (201) ;mRNA; f:93509-94233